MVIGIVLVLLAWSLSAAYLRYRRHQHALEQWRKKPPASLKRRVEVDE